MSGILLECMFEQGAVQPDHSITKEGSIMRIHTTIGFAAASAGVILLTASVTASAQTASPSPAARTCAAFETWSAHRTQPHLDAMMTASESAPWKWLGNDVTELYSGVRENDAKYIAYGVKYVKKDCAKVS